MLKGGQLGNKNAEKWTEEDALKLGNELIEWLKEPPKFNYLGKNETPQLISANLYTRYFLSQRGYYDTLIDYLSEKFDSFSKLFAHAQRIQESKIAELTLIGMLNAGFSNTFLSNHHGYKNKTETDITTKGEAINANNLTLEQINEKLAKLDAIRKRD